MVGTKFENGSNQIVTAPKTKAGIRSVHLHQAITELLERIPQDARTGYLYGTRKGTAVNGSTFRGRVFKPLMLKLGYPGIWPNDFRHYCITDLTNFAIKAQIDLKCVSDMVGYANVSTTLNIYNEAGQLVKTLINNQNMAGGSHQVSWGGLNNNGQPASSGVYFYTLEWDGNSVSQQMVYLK